ncbi:MAG TPA: sigma 54-interacting transcriptional regulator [Pyrinomonadaceae bacterium]|nr:sigma 54-interacting transcriptional regulator [Pyrinomonadaceae bacterium]
MVLTFLDDGGLKRHEVENKLCAEGFELRPLTGWQQPAAPGVGIAFAAVFIFRSYDSELVDRALETCVRVTDERGGSRPRVICCTEELPPEDEANLREWGAAKVIRPAAWNESDVADRVLAALFGGFGISVRDGEVAGGERPYMLCWVPFKGRTAPRKIIGATRVMRDLFEEIELYSSVRDPVLIRGDTGTGKELVAAAIHSPNKKGQARYITINIAEISPGLLANELFGHSPEAFTDARHERPGLLAEAKDGTVFIDEIGDLDKDNQTRLLRVFSNLEIRPVGAAHEKRIPFLARLIFATHQPLEEKCVNGEFRHDLYRRITEGHTINLRKLWERKGDLELLAKEFFGEWHAERKHHANIYSLRQSDYDKIVDLCIKHEFLGNLRGLRGILRGSFSRGLRYKTFDVKDLEHEIDVDQNLLRLLRTGGDETDGSAPPRCSIPFDPRKETFKKVKAKVPDVYFTEIFREAKGDVKVAMRLAGVGKKTFYNYCTEEKRRAVLESLNNSRDAQAASDGGPEISGAKSD